MRIRDVPWVRAGIGMGDFLASYQQATRRDHRDLHLSLPAAYFLPEPSQYDRAGNFKGAAFVTINIDRVVPELTATMPPAQLVQNATHDFRLSASDALSGIASASCAPVDTATLGAKTATCTATDKAGNVTTRESAYDVVPKRMRTGGPQRPELSPSRIPRPAPVLRPGRARR